MDAPEASIHIESINSTRPMETRPADVPVVRRCCMSIADIFSTPE